jgi:uncharacterized protein YbjT (DUF2867 family)
MPTQDVKPLIAVFGGTGKQGGSVAKALLRDGRWRVRILSRNSTSKKALKFSGFSDVEVMQGNMHNVDDLRRFLSGCYGCFAMTNFWDPESMFKEEMIGRQIVQVAREAGVQHFVWSTLPNVEKITGGKWAVPHFTDKARVDKYVRQAGFATWSFVMPAFYYQNFATMFPPKKEGNLLIWTLPILEDKYLATVDIKDMGPVVQQMFRNPELYHNKKIPVVGDNMHPQDYLIKMSLISNTPTKVELIPPEAWAKSGTPHADEIAQMFAYFSEFGYYGNKYNLSLGKQIYPALKTWEQYIVSAMCAAQQGPMEKQAPPVQINPLQTPIQSL